MTNKKATGNRTAAQQTGQFAEDEACKYLLQQGMRFIMRNYRCRMGEIDLIFRDETDVVFVEVRYRKSAHFGDGAESVNYFKQQKLIRAAALYIQRYSVALPCRFDVISVAPGLDKKLHFEWIKSAFETEW